MGLKLGQGEKIWDRGLKVNVERKWKGKKKRGKKRELTVQKIDRCQQFTTRTGEWDRKFWTGDPHPNPRDEKCMTRTHIVCSVLVFCAMDMSTLSFPLSLIVMLEI